MRLIWLLFGIAWLSSFDKTSAQPALSFSNIYHTYHKCNRDFAPSVVNFNKQYQIYYMDPSGNGLFGIWALQDNLIDWFKMPGNVNSQDTSSTPNAIAQYPNNSDTNFLNLFFMDTSGNDIMQMTGSGNPIQWSVPVRIGIEFDNQPEAAVSPHDATYPNRTVVVGAQHEGNAVMVATFDENGKKVYSGMLGNSKQSDSPCVVFFNDNFYVFYPDEGGTPNSIKMVNSADGVSWTAEKSVGNYKSAQGLSAVVYHGLPVVGKDYLYLFYPDPAGTKEVFYIYSEDAITWINPANFRTGLIIDMEPSVTFKLGATFKSTEFVIAGRSPSDNEMIFITATPA